MIRIYTPSNWMKLFEVPSMIIEDDGYIYGDDHASVFRSPIGKVDSNGYIYGRDYGEFGAQPVGRIVENGSETRIFGSDYASFGAQPVYYIKDGQIYSSDEYYKVLRTSVGYVKQDSAGGNTLKETGTSNQSNSGKDNYMEFSTDTFSSQSSVEPIEKKTSKGYTVLGMIIIIGITLLVLAVGLYIPYYFCVSEGATEIVLYSLAIGAVAALLLGRSWSGCIKVNITFSILGMFAIDVYQTYQNGNFTVGGLILTLFLGAIVYGLVTVVPSALLGSLAWAIKRPLVKKKGTAEKRVQDAKK